MNEPRLKDFDVPSSAVWLAAAVTAGATFATVTVKVLVSLAPVLLFVTLTVTVRVASSANVCDLAMFPVVAWAKLSDEPSPQLTLTVQGPAAPSVNEPRLNDFDVPSVAVWSVGAVTASPDPPAPKAA